MTFPDLMRQARKAKGLSQNELAAQLGVSRVAISSYEVGIFGPSLEMAFNIAKFLGFSLGHITALTNRDEVKAAKYVEDRYGR